MQQRVVELTASQTKFFDDEHSKAIAFVTGFGGGKTFCLVTKMVNTKLKHPKADLLYLLPVYSMFRDILFPTLIEVLEGTGISYRINKTTGEIFFDCGGRVILKSMDNPESIVGMNVFAVFLDELDTLPYDKAWQVWIKALARARYKINEYEEVPELFEGEETGKTVKQIKLDSNGEEIELENQMVVGSTPEGFRLLYKLFDPKNDPPENYTLIQASGYENIHLHKGYYDNLKAIYPAELVEAYIEGKFVNMAIGAVYPNYDRDDCNSDAVYRDGEELFISIDFNVNNMNAIVFVKRDKVFIHNPLFQYEGEESAHAVDHLYGIKDTPELINVIREKYPRSPIYAFPDASGKNASSKGFTISDISLMDDAGFHCEYPSKNPRILERVQSVNSALKTGLVKVNVRKCKKLAESLEQQVYNKNTELPEKSASSSIDDINDAFGYFIHYVFPILRRVVKTNKIEGL